MIFPKNTDPKRLLEEQEAFQESERRRAEARAQAIFDSLVDFSPIPIEIYNPDGNLLKSNKTAERLLGKIPPPGTSLNEERGLKRTGLLEPQIKRLLAGARIETPPFWYDPQEIGLPPTQKGKICLRVTAFPLLDFEGAVKMIAVMYEDLTDLKKAEDSLRELKNSPVFTLITNENLEIPIDARDVEFARRKVEQAWRESEERYRTLIEGVQDACIIRIAENGQILAISPTVQQLFGVSREAVITDSSILFANVHPDDLQRVRTVEQELKKTGQSPYRHRFRVIKKPGDEIVHLEMMGKVCSFANRRTTEILVLNITPEKQLEEILSKKEKDFAALLSSPDDGTFLLNREWVITAWSKGAEKETRVPTGEAIGKRLWEVYPEAEKSGMVIPIRKTLLDHQPQYQDFFYQDGRERYAGWFSLSTYPVADGVFAIIRNITTRKKIELAWQDTESRLRTILENDKVLIAFKDRTLRYTGANLTAKKIYGNGDELINKTDAELFPATVTALLGSQDRQVIESGNPVNLDICLGDPKSEKGIWLSLSKLPWRNTNGEIVGVIDVGFDITRQVRAIQELQRRREELGKILNEHADLLNRAQNELKRWT